MFSFDTACLVVKSVNCTNACANSRKIIYACKDDARLQFSPRLLVTSCKDCRKRRDFKSATRHPPHRVGAMDYINSTVVLFSCYYNGRKFIGNYNPLFS